MILRALIIVCAVVAGCAVMVHGKVYERCELARELRDVHEIPDSQLATWLCIARYESEYNTSAINHGSGDHGLLQISQLFWCSPPGYACGVSCKDMRNDDIEDDVICARRIYREHKRLSGDGFNAWAVYGHYCRDKHYANGFLEGCFKPGVLKTATEEKETPLPTVNYYPQFTRKSTTTQSSKETANTESVPDMLAVVAEKTTTPKITTTTKRVKTTVRAKFTTVRPTINTTKFLRTTKKPTTTTTKAKTSTRTTTAPKASIVTKKLTTTPSIVTTGTTKKSTLVHNNYEEKLLRPTEENDEFTYAISKTGYKFARF